MSLTHISKILFFVSLLLISIHPANGRFYMKFVRRFVCHHGFIVRGVCFQLHLSPATYEEADAICQSNNGTLAQYTAHGVHKILVHLGLNNIRVGMKYSKDCEPFSDETGSHETIESNWFRRFSRCDKEKPGRCMLLVRDKFGRRRHRVEKRAFYVNDRCNEKRPFMCKIHITADWKLVRIWNEVVKKNAVARRKVEKITPSSINDKLGVDLPEGDLRLPISKRAKRTINPYNMSPFHNGIICYKIDDGYTEENKQFIVDQMTKISSKCCVKFLELNPDNMPLCDNHYVRIFNGKGCWSFVGKTILDTDPSNGFTYQDLSLYHTDRITCLVPDVTQHELLHAVGFWHEHSRADRDYYVKIYPENAKDGKQHNFQVKDHDVYMAMGSFDIMSTMMYSYDEFLNTSRAPYTVLDRMSPFGIDDNTYFGSTEFSDEDMNKCNRIYHQLCKARDGSEPPYYEILTPWTPWSACSKVCGGGTRKRMRHCNVPGGCQNVAGAKEQQEACNTQPCPERYSYRHLGTFKASRAPQGWLEVDVSKYRGKGWDDIRMCAEAAKDGGFTEFGLLEGKCLHGVDYLENGPFLFSTKDGRGSYALGLFDAVDVYTLSQNADRLMKGYWTAWSGWSSCSASCGQTGIQIRSREWLRPNGVNIPYDENQKSETRPCNRFNCEFQCGDSQCLYGDCVDGRCNCWPGYLGQKCTKDVNVCECCSERTFTGNCQNVSADACCDPNAYCIDKFGSFVAECLCKEGFLGDGHRCQKNPCDDDSCGDHEVCTVGKDLNPVCNCQHGYKHDPVTSECVAIDECAGVNKCSASKLSECKNLNGTYMCLCVEGTIGDGINCTDIDECALGSHNCPPQTVCENLSPSYTCKCKSGFKLINSECIDIDECATGGNACHINASCSNIEGSYTCTCNSGYQGDGRYCTDIDECKSGTDLCSSDAICSNVAGSYTCSCKPGYEGDGSTCTDIDECSSGLHDCSENAVCTNTVGTHVCSCMSGYTGDGRICQDVDECDVKLYKCHVNATCFNADGSYKCQCKPGFVGDGTSCSDIDECASKDSKCDPNADCQNTVGSYKCTCKTGYKGDGISCQDVNECTNDVCDSNALCTNTDGSYECTCKTGYLGNGETCSRVDPCAADDIKCHTNADCTPVNGYYTCSCKPGYKGDGTTCIKCANSDCSDPCPSAEKAVNLATKGQVTHHGLVTVADHGVNGPFANLTDPTAFIELDGSCLNNPESCSEGLTVSLWFRQSTEQRNHNIFEMPEAILTSGPEPVPGVTEDDGLGVIVYRNVKGHSLTVLLRVNNADYICDIASSMFENDKWNQIAFTWSTNNGLRIYFNGHLRDADAMGQIPGSARNIYDSLYFGHALQYQDHNYFLGSYGEFRMWERVLTEEEIYQNYKCNIQNACTLNLCHAHAACAEDGCQCTSGSIGDGFTCTPIKEPDLALKLPEVSHYWKMTSLSNQDIVPTRGKVKLVHDNRLKPVMKVVDGVYRYERSVMCDGRHDAFKSDADFSDLCHGVPDKCKKGLTITFWIRFDGRDLFGSFMRPNFILSTGGHAGSETTGISLWVLGSQLHVNLQTTTTRYQAKASIYPLGLWKHIGVVFRQPTSRDQGSLSIFINGQRVAMATGKPQMTEAAGNHYLTLCRPNNCQAFMGRFDMNRLAMWNAPLLAQNIVDIHDHGVFGDGE